MSGNNLRAELVHSELIHFSGGYTRLEFILVFMCLVAVFLIFVESAWKGGRIYEREHPEEPRAKHRHQSHRTVARSVSGTTTTRRAEKSMAKETK